MSKTLQYISIGGAVWSASVFVLGLWMQNVISRELHTVKQDLHAENVKSQKAFADSLRQENRQNQAISILIEYLEEKDQESQERQLEFFKYLKNENKNIKELIRYKEAQLDTVLFEDQHGKMWQMIRGDYFGKPIYKQIPFEE